MAYNVDDDLNYINTHIDLVISKDFLLFVFCFAVLKTCPLPSIKVGLASSSLHAGFVSERCTDSSDGSGVLRTPQPWFTHGVGIRRPPGFLVSQQARDFQSYPFE